MLLAFGLSMGVDRYEKRRQTVVAEANAIGTTYLRAELLAEPERSRSLQMLQQYTDARIELSDTDVDSTPFDVALSASHDLQRSLWSSAGTAVADRVSALRNRIPSSVLLLHIAAGGFAMASLGLFISLHGKGTRAAFAGSVLVALILLVVVDLDRPRRGFVIVPNAPLTDLRAGMNDEPAAGGPILSG